MAYDKAGLKTPQDFGDGWGTNEGRALTSQEVHENFKWAAQYSAPTTIEIVGTGDWDGSNNYTISDGPLARTVLASSGATDRTVILPTAAANSAVTVTVKKVDSGSGTVTIDGEGAETIDQLTTFLLSDMGQWVTLVCDGSGWQSVAWSDPPTMIVEDQKTSGTDGGSVTSGAWRTRDLNTEVYNGISGASLAANQITLPAGTYEVWASAPAYRVDRHMIRLRNVTDSSTEIWGQSSWAADQNVNQDQTTLYGRITISSSSVFELQHEVETGRSNNGFGFNAGSSLTIDHETYSRVVIEKVG